MSDAETTDVPVVPYFLVLLLPGDQAESAPRFYDAHIRHVDRMAAANVVLLGGDFDEAIDGATGAYLLHAASRADAETWAAQDPLVLHHACRARIVTWNLVGITPGAIDPALTST